ncbi:MAG: F0F1 ATP synthase subunit A [Lachnospiraceae bacterium]
MNLVRKEGDSTKGLTERLLEELNCRTVFTIPVLGGIGVDESVVVTWMIMAVLVGLSVIFVRNLKVENPGKIQIVLESAIGWAQDFFEGIIGKENKRYIPYLITIVLYLGFSNIIGLFGLKPPTKDLNVTAALAIMSMCLIEYSGIHKNGAIHWMKHFTKPVALVTPIMVMEIFIRPLSLCMRLFGNMLGGFVVMELLKMAIPILVPIPFSFYFDIFDGLLQAYVFVFLTALFMNEEME